ncbi:putative ribonuclease H-like domain-containing protein [Tanacetum coccineum]
MIDYALWEVIENGTTLPKTQMVKGVMTVMPITSAEDKAQRRLEVKARSTLMIDIPNEHQLKFNSIKDAKLVMEAIEKRFGGNAATKKTQRNLLKHQYENFTTPSSEMLDQTFDRLQKLLLRSLSPEWNTHAVVWRNKAELETMSMDDLYNNLKVYEPEVKGMSSSSSSTQNMAFVSSSNNNTSSSNEAVNAAHGVTTASTQTIGFDKSKVECYNCHKRGHFARECKALRNQDNNNKEVSRRSVPMEITTSTALFVNEPIAENSKAKSNEEEPKEVRKNDDTLIIKEWVSDSEEENVSQTKTKKKTVKPSIAKIEFVKPKQQDKTARKTVKQSSTNKCAKKNLVPRAVLMKSGLVSVNTARQVNVAHSKTTVNVARPMSYLSKTAHLTVKRPIHKNTTFKNSYINQKVNTVRGKKFNTARLKAVVNAVKGNNFNDVKASTCWVWKPKQKVLDHVSKHNSASITLKKIDYIDAQGNPQMDLQDQRMINSGCSRHMTENMSYLTNYEEIDGGYVAFGGNPKGGKITGKCTIKTVPRKNNMYSVDLKNIVPKGGLTCLFAKATSDKSKLWHRRLGHLNFKTMNKLVKGNLVRGLPSKLFKNDQTYVACQKRKQHRASCKSKTKNSISLPLYLLHMDLFGPTFIKSLMKKMYCLVVTYDFSRFTWVFFLSTKDETSAILNSFITGIENLVDHKVKVIRCVNGTEFKNKEMNQFCEMKGILRQFNVARTPQQNGVAERRNRTLLKAARTMLADSKLTTTFWAEAVNTACYVQNRVLVVKPHNKTPYKHHLGKFDGKADEGFFVGYSLNSKVFRVFNSRTRIVEENLHIRFSENTPNVVGSGPDWLFDIDALTRTMNYEPIVAGTQSNGFAGTKASDNAGQARKETEPVKNYILLPLWTADPPFSQDPKSSHDDGSKPSSDNGKKVDEDPRKESECNDQEKEDNVNSTNNVNVASTNEVNAVEADMNNLDTTIQVSPIPTTRIHKDHPLDQVIGDLQSATQTRRMSKKLEEHGFIKAMQEELLQFKLQEVWTLVDLPNGKRAIGTKWVFRNKKDERGIMIRNKARLVAQGYTQEEGIDYDEVFSPIARIKATRLFLAYDSFKYFMVYQMDIKSAFLYGKIEEGVYVCQPLGFEDPDFPDRVYKVGKALYGLHQAPKAWYETLSTYLTLKGQPKLGLWYPKDSPCDLVAYTDSDYAGASLDRKSTTGGCQFLRSRLISWQCKKQIVVANSTTEAEYVAASSCCGQVLWIQNQLFDYGLMLLGITYAELLLLGYLLLLVMVNAVEGIFINTSIKGFNHSFDQFHTFFADTHNMVAFLAKPAESEGFEQIGDFLYAHTIRYALTINPTIYTSCIEQLWATVKVKTVNGEVQLQALVDGKKIIIIESIVRRDLQLEDVEGADCLPNAIIFEQLTLMGYEKISQKLTFYKSFFSPQWKFFIHIIIQCLCSKTTAWNEFSSTMASAIICLATNQKFNFSKYIFESMVKNLDNVGKFLMYPRFVQVFVNQHLDGLPIHKRTYIAPSHTKKIFGIRRVGKGFSGRETPLFQTMVVKDQAEIDKVADKAVNEEMDDSLVRANTTATSLDAEQDSGNINKAQSKATPYEPSSPGTSSGGGPRRQETMGDIIAQTRSENVSKHSNDPLLARGNTLRSGEDRLKLEELMALYTTLQSRVLALETTKTTQATEIASSKRRVKKLEKRNKSRTHRLKRLYRTDEDMFGVNDLDGDEVIIESVDVVKTAEETTTLRSID